MNRSNMIKQIGNPQFRIPGAVRVLRMKSDPASKSKRRKLVLQFQQVAARDAVEKFLAGPRVIC